MYGRNRYFETRVKTARPEEITVMLYDGMLTRVERLKEALTQDEPGEASLLVNRLMDILGHLQATLMTDHAPELGAHLATTYETWTSLIVQSRLRQDPTSLTEVHAQMLDLRGAWAQAATNADAQAA